MVQADWFGSWDVHIPNQVRPMQNKPMQFNTLLNVLALYYQLA